MLSQRMQFQVLIDLLAGLPAPFGAVPADLDEPYRSCYLAIARAPAGRATAALRAHLRSVPGGDQILATINAGTPGLGPRPLPSYADLAARSSSVDWLWPNWIPRGMLALLGAAPGTGKSYVALDLARRIVAGEPFPDGAPPVQDGRVIYVDAETAPQILGARLAAWRFDARRLFIMQSPAHDPLDLSRPAGRDRLIEAVYATTRPSLVVIDSLSAATSRGENRIEDVRAILAFLASLANDHACAILLIHHLRKHTNRIERETLGQDDFRGSSHVTAVPRCVLGLSVVQTTPHFDRAAPRKLEVVKTNLGPYPDPLGITFEPLGPVAGAVAARLRYGPVPQPHRAPTQIDQCAAWLLEVLRASGRPMSAGECVKLAAEAGFSRAQLFRARALLGPEVRDTHGRKSPHNLWCLPDMAPRDSGQ